MLSPDCACLVVGWDGGGGVDGWAVARGESSGGVARELGAGPLLCPHHPPDLTDPPPRFHTRELVRP